MTERFLEEPIELTDAELKVVSGGLQSPNGVLHEDGFFGHGENPRAQANEDAHTAAGIGPAKNGNTN